MLKNHRNRYQLLTLIYLTLLMASCSKDGNAGKGTPPPPKADFIASRTNINLGDTVFFTDRSLGQPIFWTWSFPGATPSTSSAANPGAIVYTSAGIFPVTLVVRNSFGSDSVRKDAFITVFNPAALPIVLTNGITAIEWFKATVSGSVTNQGASIVTERGILFDSLPEPTIETSSRYPSGAGTGPFNITRTDLSQQQRYYVRAYAINNDGVGYGEILDFRTPERDPCEGISTFTDPRDGRQYRQIDIGNQTWLAENLQFNAPGSLCYDGQNANCTDFGRLYTWESARTACPTGWRLPTDAEWAQLISTVGSAPGGKLKSREFWNNPNTGATNAFCFSALPGGYRTSGTGAAFINKNFFGYWWTNTNDGTNFAVARSMAFNSNLVDRLSLNRLEALSVRCVKN